MVRIAVKSNSMWVNPEHVSAVEGNGLRGSKGSTIHLVGGQSIQTGYPVTELQALLFGGKQ